MDILGWIASRYSKPSSTPDPEKGSLAQLREYNKLSNCRLCGRLLIFGVKVSGHTECATCLAQKLPQNGVVYRRYEFKDVSGEIPYNLLRKHQALNDTEEKIKKCQED